MENLCVELAANLTSHYFSPAVYDFRTESLERYLSNAGVLITMCMLSPQCDNLRPDIADHWSGSWLQESTTGLRVIGNGGLGVGVVLDPEFVDPSCVYPIDGGTLSRDEMGCGEFDFGKNIPRPKRLLMSAYAQYRKYTKFPTTAWADIPCSEFFDDQEMPMVTSMVDENQTWKSFKWLQKNTFETVMGHTVCFDDTVADFGNDRTLLLYAGDVPWSLDQWNETMSTMKSIIEQHPTSVGIWNEVVFQMPPGNKLTSEMIQAVFYYGSSFRHAAAKEAKRLGNIPLLELDPRSRDQKVFQCSSRAMEHDSVS